MTLQKIIDEYEAGILPDRTDPSLEAARLVVESAVDHARHQPTLAPLRGTLLNIESTISRTLANRSGCND